MRRFSKPFASIRRFDFLPIEKIKLMTNNPAKVEELAKDGFDVRMVEHKTAPNKENKDYLDTKAKKMDHEL